MKILALDTSSMPSTAAVVDEYNIISEFTINYKKTHSQTIMPIIDIICNMVELDINTIDYIAVASGPGSFTGLRIGASTAKGLAHALNKPIVPVPTLDGLAYNIFETNKIICPIMDAKRGHVYSALYTWNNRKLEKLTEYLAEPIEDIINIALTFETEVIFLGDGVPINIEKLKQLIPNNFIIAPPSCNMQRAGSIGSLALELIKDNKTINYAEFAPFYIRKSQAEREYEQKHKHEVEL